MSSRFTTTMVQFCRDKYSTANGRVTLLLFPLDPDVQPDELISDIANRWAEQSIFYILDGTEKDWLELEQTIEPRQDWVMTVIVESADSKGAHFYPTRKNTPDFVRDIISDIYEAYLNAYRKVN